MTHPDSSTYLKAMGIPVWKWRGGDSPAKEQSELTVAVASGTTRLVMAFQGTLGVGVWVAEYLNHEMMESAVMDLWHAMARATKIPFIAQDWGLWGDSPPKALIFFGDSLKSLAPENSEVIVTHSLYTLLNDPQTKKATWVDIQHFMRLL